MKPARWARAFHYFTTDDNAPAETVKKADGTWTWPFAPHGLPPIMAWAKNKMHGSLLVPYSSAFRWGEGDCKADKA